MQFLTKIQTFKLRIITKAELKSPINKMEISQLIALPTKHTIMIHLLLRVKSEY